MIKVTLLGDSIRQGYGKRVAELLGDGFEVFQPEDNCRFAQYMLRGLFDWKDAMADSRIVHWNCGLWDVCDLFGDGAFTREAEYTDTVLRIARLLLREHEAVIFATTTPVDPRNPYNRNEVIARYNQIIVPELQKLGVQIDDLYALVQPHIDAYIRKDDLLHLTDDGVEAAAVQVADSIRAAAARLK